MSDKSTLSVERMVAVLRRAGAPDEPGQRAVLAELWANPQSDALPQQVELPAIEAAGAAAALAGEDEAQLVRRILAMGRMLADGALERGELPAASAARLEALVDEAAARAVAAYARAAHERRESWLSFLNHELKNPLNTILNALWLLREQRDAPNADRFLELAERAVRKMEGILKELRDLHRKAASPPPMRDGGADRRPGS